MSEPVASDRPRPPYLRRSTRPWWKRTVTWIMVGAGLAVAGFLLLLLYLHSRRASDDDDDGRRAVEPVRIAKS